ncbi:putative ABC transporter [Trypanosoma vivax]|uniref:ABC transported putative n=1 Tax=Trypanosoma vivax (strain Y486) TaxID=1055687 RepID=G0UBS7_TRYVY|nr:putative ABC transported [Trypanosoma vivax]KAH8609576.1 putative ABC transporter [Trypanosoma vivax]CCC53275.1 ABC transported putative [Trypanosoma vivax Y486]
MQTEPTPIISCENIHKTYLLGTEGVAALRGVRLDVQRGEFLIVFGSSGGGKSSLLNVLGTIDLPTKGNLHLFGHRITDQASDSELAHLRCHRMGFVFQSFNLISTMNALDNVCLPMIIAGKRSLSDIKKRATQLLTSVGLEHRLYHHPAMLSGGEQQRVTIARALANDPEVLLLDEPTGDLDTRNTHLVMDILMKLNSECELTMIMVTHDLYLKPYAHRIVYMRDGRIQNIESVHPAVRKRAMDNLRSTVSRIGGSMFEITPATSVTRDPTDYETVAAQADIVVEEDPEMQDVVNTLFLNLTGD